MRVLFVCNQNKHRSKTAEELFSASFETASAGLYAGELVTQESISWADLVVVMEDEQRLEISKRFPTEYLRKRILSLGISDVYHYNQPELKEILQFKMSQAL